MKTFKNNLLKGVLIFAAILVSPFAIAQTVQLNGAATTCTSLTIAPINGVSGFNIISNPANCLSVGGAAQQTQPFSGQVTASIQSTAAVAEGNTVNIPVTLFFNGGAQVPAGFTFTNAVTITFNIGGGTAVQGTNYTTVTASPLTIQGGATTGYIQVAGLNNNTVDAGGKTLTVTLTGIAIQGQSSATAALGAQTTSNVTITDAVAPAGGADTAVDGTPISNPSRTAGVKFPPSHSGLNGGGVYINAWEVPMADCTATPALTHLFQHNINLSAFSGWAEQVSLKPNEALVYSFTVPNVEGKTGSVAFGESTQGVNAADFAVLSKKRCDFDTAKVGVDRCYQTATGGAFTLPFMISSTIMSHWYYCVLKPGDKIYMNYRFQNANATPKVDSCAAMNPANGVCGTAMIFSLQQ